MECTGSDIPTGPISRSLHGPPFAPAHAVSCQRQDHSLSIESIESEIPTGPISRSRNCAPFAPAHGLSLAGSSETPAVEEREKRKGRERSWNDDTGLVLAQCQHASRYDRSARTGLQSAKTRRKADWVRDVVLRRSQCYSSRTVSGLGQERTMTEVQGPSGSRGWQSRRLTECQKRASTVTGGRTRLSRLALIVLRANVLVG